MSWALVEECAIEPLAMPMQMLGAEVSRWLRRACLLK